MSKLKRGQNEVSCGYFRASDLRGREEKVLKDVSNRVGFTPKKLVGRSTWWGSSEVGAFHYSGVYDGKKTVLKIQGVKPKTSEKEMIEAFSKTNKSRIIRPPYLYAHLPWDDDRQYEALVLEYIDGPKIVHAPTTVEQVKRFFEIYLEYRRNCRTKPWLKKPQKSISESVTERFAKWREMSFKIYPDHPLRKKDDKDLIDMAVEKLIDGYEDVQPEFVHGHLSDRDLYKMGNSVVILSNLYWSWRAPFYDAVFAYHWFIYRLSDVAGITPEEIEKQREIWLRQINSLAEIQGREGERLLKLALLERATAGLNLDALSVNPNNPISNYLLEATRNQIGSLLGSLKKDRSGKILTCK